MRFEIFPDGTGDFRFRLKADNGEILAASEGYTKKKNCAHAVDLIVEGAKKAAIEEIDTPDEWLVKVAEVAQSLDGPIQGPAPSMMDRRRDD